MHGAVVTAIGAVEASNTVIAIVGRYPATEGLLKVAGTAADRYM